MNIGFIGAGRMGNPMAQHLIKNGHDLKVHDLSRSSTTNLEEMGAQWVASPKQTAQNCEVIFSSLPGPMEIEAVAIGDDSILEGASAGSVYIDLSTNSPKSTRMLHDVFLGKGVKMLDAPVSGGVTGAANATLSVMVGGDEGLFNQTKQVLECIGDRVMYCGPIGSGMVCKLCNNLTAMSLVAFLPEILTLGVKAGVELETVSRAVTNGSGGTWIMENKYPKGLYKGNFDPGFSLALAAKDVRLATDLGRELGLPMEASNLLEQRYIEAIAKGFGSSDADAVALLYEERTGIRLRTQDG